MSNNINFQEVLNEFLKLREWTDELNVDPETSIISLNTEIQIEGQDGRLIIEANPESQIVDVFIYYSIMCRENKINELALLMNQIHHRWAFGRFEVYESGHIRWRQRYDFEGTKPTGLSIDRIVQPGWDAVGKFFDLIAAVALTKTTALQAIEEYDGQS